MLKTDRNPRIPITDQPTSRKSVFIEKIFPVKLLNEQVYYEHGGNPFKGLHRWYSWKPLSFSRASVLGSILPEGVTIGDGKEPLRRDFLRAIAPNAILVLDEAHEAGGSKGGWTNKNEPPNRAAFVRELVDAARGAFFSSATAIKRPDVIDLYARKTDLRHAVQDVEDLSILLDQGGVPLQQVVAAGMVEGGDMRRLERSYEGISFQAKVVAVDRNVVENLAAAMRAIVRLGRSQNFRKAMKSETC